MSSVTCQSTGVASSSANRVDLCPIAPGLHLPMLRHHPRPAATRCPRPTPDFSRDFRIERELPRRTVNNVALGFTLSIAATVIFGVQDAMAELLVQDYSPFQLAMIRFWAFAAFSLFLVARQGRLRTAFHSKQPVTQLIRATLLVVDIWLFAAALKTVPLAELQAIVLIYPLLATLAAIPLLGGEGRTLPLCCCRRGFSRGAGHCSPRRAASRPWRAVCGPLGDLLRTHIALTRKVSATDSTATSMLYVGAVGLVLTTAVGSFFWQPVDWQSVPLLAGLWSRQFPPMAS